MPRCDGHRFENLGYRVYSVGTPTARRHPLSKRVERPTPAKGLTPNWNTGSRSPRRLKRMYAALAAFGGIVDLTGKSALLPRRSSLIPRSEVHINGLRWDSTTLRREASHVWIKEEDATRLQRSRAGR